MHARISVSNIAALIGKNPQKKPSHAIQQYLCQTQSVKIQAIKDRLGRKTVDDLVNEALRKDASLMNDVQIGLAKTLSDASATVSTIDDTARIIEDKIGGPLAADVAHAIASTIQTERGLRNENNVLDLQESETGLIVTDRNTKTRVKTFDGAQPYTIVGRIDGLAGDRILDAKERKRKWASVPQQDMIQMRAQMELQDLPEAELVERFPDGTRRNTLQKRTPEDWQPIREALDQAVRNLVTIASDESLLENLVQECTVGESV